MVDAKASDGPGTDWIAFGPFVLHLRRQVLAHDGKPVPLNPRSLDLLIALLERPGEVLSKAELLSRIWRDRTVDEVNLRVAVAALRRRLAAGGTGVSYILNLAGRGYAFSSDVPLEYWPSRASAPSPSEPKAMAGAQGRLPVLLKSIVGRDGAKEAIVRLLKQHRLLTVVGTAGIGKTTVAVAAAAQLTQGGEEVRFVDFAPGRDPGLVLARIAAALTLDQVAGDALHAILTVLAERRVLIILDNCEHVVDAAAAAVADILQGAPGVRFLATSREPLRADGEVVYRLERLKFPGEDFAGGARDALSYHAVQLLVERVQAVSPGFILPDVSAVAAAEICRRLDGIALAIELAAGRVATFGMEEVASRLDDRFRFLGQAARAAPPRQQTLDAAVGWSFELLDERERLVCIRLAIFSGEFSLSAAIDIAGWSPVLPHEAAAILASLVEKSLVVFVADPIRPHYFFLETIRDFARAQLPVLDADNALLQKLAERLMADCDQFVELARRGESAESTALARRRMDDLRYAIARAFKVGDVALQSALLAKCAPLMFHLGVIFDLAAWLGQALQNVTGAQERLPLLLPYARAMYLSRPDQAAQIALYVEAAETARTLRDRDSELRARWGLSYGSGPDYSAQQCLEGAAIFQQRALDLGDVSATFVADTLKGRALHDLGAFVASMEVHRRVVDGYPGDLSAADASRFGLNHRAIAMSDLSESSWQIGAMADAETWNQASLREAGDHLPTLFIPSSQHICRAIWEGTDWPGVERQFDEIARQFNVDGRWKNWIRNLDAIVEIQRYASRGAFSRLDSDILSGRWETLTDRYIWIVVHFIQCCMTVERADAAVMLADKLVGVLRQRQTRWMLPEALRLQALALVGVGRGEAALTCFDEAAAVADAIGASSFATHIKASFKASRDRLPPGSEA